MIKVVVKNINLFTTVFESSHKTRRVKILFKQYSIMVRKEKIQ